MVAPHARTTPADTAPNQGVELDPLRNPERRRRAAAASAIDIACGAQSDSFVLPAAADVIAPYIAAAHEQWDGPLPHVRSEEWLDAPDAVKLATLLTCGVAYLVADPHRIVRHALKQVALDIHGAADWRRVATTHLPNDVLRARRGGAA